MARLVEVWKWSPRDREDMDDLIESDNFEFDENKLWMVNKLQGWIDKLSPDNRPRPIYEGSEPAF